MELTEEKLDEMLGVIKPTVALQDGHRAIISSYICMTIEEYKARTFYNKTPKILVQDRYLDIMIKDCNKNPGILSKELAQVCIGLKKLRGI